MEIFANVFFFLLGGALVAGVIRKHPKASIEWLNKVRATAKAKAKELKARAKAEKAKK